MVCEPLLSLSHVMVPGQEKPTTSAVMGSTIHTPVLVSARCSAGVFPLRLPSASDTFIPRFSDLDPRASFDLPDGFGDMSGALDHLLPAIFDDHGCGRRADLVLGQVACEEIEACRGVVDLVIDAVLFQIRHPFLPVRDVLSGRLEEDAPGLVGVVNVLLLVQGVEEVAGIERRVLMDRCVDEGHAEEDLFRVKRKL